jgi:CheY-like chemotaxis protein
MRDSDEQARILLVEDNRGDVRLTRETLRELGLEDALHVARDGVEAMDYLARRGAYADALRPGLILLDLNLPRKDGRAVLRELKEDSDLRRIPVVVLTTSHADEDVRNAYDLHANCYVTKPIELDEFLGALRAIVRFWLQTVRLPAS